MTFGFFLLGAVMMGVGFFMVYRTDLWREWFGDLGVVMGLENASWFGWKFAGMLAMLLGFLVAFGLLELFFAVTVGRFFSVGAGL